jgi:hypothetical protein
MDRTPQSKCEKLGGRIVCFTVSAALAATAFGLWQSDAPTWAVALVSAAAALYAIAAVIRIPNLRRLLLGSSPLV